ncbi:hypothetical protein HPB49_009604 [Dermacentor silvarum]|uniref:Uncharacterized protein n=1 Tax=Dermacentor silvarum TaxID=543639 RepID=A0ACB8DYM5_DERSI|nr:hypothetical protein HPB49_009604 [Dermacentor silvarum]
MPVTRNGTSSTAPASEEDGERRSTDGGEGNASRGVPNSVSTSGTTSTPAPMFDMSAVLQATVQAAVREAINAIVHLQSQQAVAMPVIGAGETSRLVPLFDPTSSDSPTVDAWIRRVDDLAEVYRWSDRLTSCNALARLDGPAKMWYDSLQSVNRPWPEWKVELKRAFPTTSGMQRLHRDMEDCIYRRGAPIESYYYDKLAKYTVVTSARKLALTDVPVLIVPNESQAIPLIVGQPFTEQPHVTLVRRGNTLRIFEEQKNVHESYDRLQSIEIPDLPKRPVCLWARESTVVPPNYIGFVKLYVRGSEPNADIFVDAQLRCQEGREDGIPRCVVNVDSSGGRFSERLTEAPSRRVRSNTNCLRPQLWLADNTMSQREGVKDRWPEGHQVGRPRLIGVVTWLSGAPPLRQPYPVNWRSPGTGG